MSTSCYWNINIVNKLHQEDTTLNPYEIRIGLSVLNDKLLDYFKNDSDALVKTDKIINNLSAEQFRSYMNEINSDRKDAHLDFIKGVKKSKIDFNKKELEIKQGVSELFASNPELANIGTQEQYSSYLETIFPDSKVKDIVYHSNYWKFDTFKGLKGNLPFSKIKEKYNTLKEASKYFGSQFWFNFQSLDTKWGDIKTPVLLNIEKLQIVPYELSSEAMGNDKESSKLFKRLNIDGIIGSTVVEDVNENPTENDIENTKLADNEIIVDSSEQIHILGSKQDLEGFKEFVNNKPVTSPSLTSKIEEVKKAYLDFSYQTRLDRVSMLTNMFSDKVTELLEQESPEGTYTLEELQENPELANKLKYKANPSKRKDIIALQNLDDNNVFNLVKKDLIAFINTPEEDLKIQEFGRFKNIPLYSDLTPIETDHILPHFIQAKKREYQKVLDNWNVLIEDVIRKVSFIEGITVKIDNTVREANVIEEQDDNPDVESIKEDDDHQESNVKDAIFTNILEQAPILNLAPEIRRILSSVPLLDNNKNIVYDDLGYEKYINFSTVYEEILQQLSKGMLDSNELIPELEKLVVGKPWVQGVIDLLNESPEFKTKLFTNSFKDSKEYLAIVSSEETDDAGSKIISLNSSEASELLYNNWRSNYASGYPLTENAVYNTSGKLIIPTIEENKNRLATLHSKLIKSKQNELLDNILLDDNIKELLNLIKALGINLDENTLRNMLIYSTSDKWTSESFNTIFGKLSLIYSGLFNDLKNERNQNTVGYDLISHYKTAFKEIAKLVTKVDNAFFLSNAREGRKTYYSYTGASMLGSFVKILSGKTNKQEVKEWVDLFKSDEWYYNERKKLWNISWLNDLVNPETYEILPDAKEFTNSLLLHNKKTEYKNYTDNVHIHSVLQLYKGKKGENPNFGYYELPTLADSGRQEVIRFKKYTDNYEEILLEKFADIVYMEINRIKKIRERYRRFNLKPNEQGYLNPALHRIKNYDIVNKDNVGGARFLFIPELNSPEYANLLDQVPDELASAKVIEIKNIIKKILDNRFEDFMMQYAKKGLFKANEKGNYAYLPYLGNREAHNKFTLSQLNSALSKLRNVNIKEINDLKTALNNNWYVPEQKVKDVFDLVNTMLKSQNSSHPLLTYTDTITNNIKNFYWNHAFASTQMIMLFAKDLAYYDGTEDFVKRFKEIIGGGQKFDTNAEYEGEKVGITHQNLIYIKDVKVKSNIYESIEHILQERVNKKYFTKQEFSDTMENFKSMSLTDSQGLKNLDTRRIEEIMLGNWTPELQQAYNHFKDGTWSKLDIDVVLNSNKFFAYGPVKYNNENDKSEVVFTQVKNSEMVMLLMGVQKTNPVLRVLNRILDESQGMLQGFQFDSAIKTGNFGAITLDINLNEQELYESLKNQIYDSKTNQLRDGIVHSVPYKYTVMQQNTPAHHKDTTIPIGTQMRFITMQDTDPNRMHSYQGKLYTTEEIKLLYNAVNVQNILNSLQEVDEIFKNGENIEKELQSLMQDRNLYTQEFADGLRWDKEKNQFRIPLYEQSHCTKVEYLLNSIIKNKIVKQKIKGGTFYQITNIGKQNDLNVRFYDKNNNLIERNDKKTKPHRIAYVEAYLSVYDSRFESYRRFLNNDGTININKIPTELLNIVAYRVPSEGPYSIFPIRVVGFTDSVSQGIMLPTDLLQISGFDFDIDKLFFFAKEFFFDKEHKLIIPKIRINGKNREDIIQSVTNQGSSKAALDNTFIDLLLEQMTSPEYTAKFFEPGSVTKLERIADILQVTEFYTEKELLKLFPGTNSIEQTLINLSSKELRKLIKNKKQLSSPIFFEETLRNRKEVMSGASLISRFALTNSAHAKLNNLGIEILKNQVIKLNGKELYILDPSTVESDEKIEFISRIIASFISSAVDNTKNPILGKLNANETTVNYITYLLRLGYNPMEVLLFMSQPIIKDFVDTAESDNNSNTPHKYIFQDVLQRYEDKFKKLTALEDIDRLSISKIDINNDLMLNSLLNAKTVRKNEVLLQNQLAIGYMFQKILPVAEMNKNLTLILRGDTTAFAGGKISNVKARELAIERFKIANQETGFLMGANDLITNLFPEHKTLTLNLLLEQKLPIVQAFTNGALFKTKELLKNYFPQYKPGYEDLISNISNMTKSGILSEYVLTELFFHSMIYFLQNNPLFGDEYLPKIKQVIPAVDKRAYYYFGFMKDWKKTIEDNPELSKLEFINRFTYTPLEFAGYNKISFKNSGKITGALRELYELEQNILMSTKKGKTLLTELFQYEYFTNGLKFSNDGFSHLFTAFLKEQLDTVVGTDQNISPTYLETVRSILTLAEDFSGKEEFIHQFIQNHPKLTALVQSADNTTYKNSFIDTDGNIRETIDISLTDLKGKNRILLKDHLLYDDELSTLQNALHDYISFDNGRILYRKTSLSSEKYNHVTYENVSILSSLEYEIGRDVQTALTQEMRNKYDPIKTKSTVSRNGFDKITENDDPYYNRNHYNDEITIENSTKKDAPNVKQLDLFAELPSNNFKDANNEFPC